MEGHTMIAASQESVPLIRNIFENCSPMTDYKETFVRLFTGAEEPKCSFDHLINAVRELKVKKGCVIAHTKLPNEISILLSIFLAGMCREK